MQAVINNNFFTYRNNIKILNDNLEELIKYDDFEKIDIRNKK